MGKIEDELSTYIHLSKYARWIEKENRRETWDETVDRLINYWFNRYPSLGIEIFMELREAIYKREVMPSMRSLMTAGPALDRDNAAAFNCAAIAVNHPRVFDEIFYLLMCGAGVGFSVERKYINKLPTVSEEFHHTDSVIKVKDSKIGWAKALKELIALLYNGDIPTWDLSEVRPAGARLKTFGGRACLAGDTILYKDRKKTRGYNEITIKQLFDMERSQGFWENKANHFKDVKLRSLDEKSGMFFRNKVISVVDNGTAPVYEVLTENGYRIKATGNHRFMNESGEYEYLDNFSVGDLIAVNGSVEKKTGVCIDCGCPISRRSLRCKSCFDLKQIRHDALGTTARQRKENRDYVSNVCERCGATGRIEVHHIDENPHNNNHQNLECLCPKCHQNHHARVRTFGDPYSHKYLSYDTIISIEYAGEEQVYDLQMEGPNHNFVANGFVSHNSGPLPLDRLLKYTCRVFKGAAGRQLTTIECHDLICKIAETVIVGSVRRSACISLSNLSDDRMRRAKTGAWWETNPERALANISVAYTEKPDMESFTKEFRNLYQSKAGERGIINKNALRRKAEECGREYEGDFLLNPCGEAILRDSGGFCCLSEVVIRPYDTLEDLKKKVRYATILGTLQVSLSNFRYLRKVWTTNQEEERLIGVSLTGIMDHEVMNGSVYHQPDGDHTPNEPLVVEWLKQLKEVAKETNIEWAEKLSINPSKQLTLVKPSGTVSQLCNTSSGIHPRYSKYYIRRVRQDIKDPLTDLMIDEGIPYVVQGEKAIFSFPVKSPEESITNSDLDALDQLNLWKIYRDHWCEGNPSQTIYYNDNTFLKVQDWVWDNWSSIGGLSFFPADDNIYENAPYESISEEKYEELVSSFPTALNWSRLNEFEKEDNTGMETEFACSGGNCELV